MPKVDVKGFGTHEVEVGQRLVLALESAGVDVLHRCGGKAKCTTCLVTFSEGEPPEMTLAEKSVLESKGLLGQGRLSCQIVCHHDMSLSVVKTVSSTGLDAGPLPSVVLEPEAVWG